MSKFHERFNHLKNISGKTQAEIAQFLNISPQSLSYYFNGREPSYDILIKISELFDVTIDYLLGKTDIKKFKSLDSDVDHIITKKNLAKHVDDILVGLDSYLKAFYHFENLYLNDESEMFKKIRVVDREETVITLKLALTKIDLQNEYDKIIEALNTIKKQANSDIAAVENELFW